MTPATSAVTVSTCSGASPAPARIAPLTNRMYAIVMNVVVPPTTSVATVDPAARTLNQRSITRRAYRIPRSRSATLLAQRRVPSDGIRGDREHRRRRRRHGSLRLLIVRRRRGLARDRRHGLRHRVAHHLDLDRGLGRGVRGERGGGGLIVGVGV